ncbi:hypothetical protein IB279_18810 [Ensifer sp. ENS06]|uniref:hypothetical protein n=1 Tax=Ensifer sp. ENS06 TaxID=2769276 RepID=UPI000DE04CC8|nr:hypothetical protein [Ensifer sp. ENS06]MBD9624985.1 hypothetical protein [Ensifer sp. ENS06]
MNSIALAPGHHLQFFQELSYLFKKRSEMETLARQLYKDHKKSLDLLKEHGSGSGFEPAVHRLFGNNPQREKAIRIGNGEFIYSGLAKSHVSFLPAQWQKTLEKTRRPSRPPAPERNRASQPQQPLRFRLLTQTVP